MKILKYGLVLLFSVTLWGCGKGNSNAPAAIDPATGKHVIANWKVPTVHGGIDFGASKDMAACQECHGKDFAGGISKKSCLNTAGCHGVGVNSPHPAAPWRGGLLTHTLVKEANAPVCAVCHTNGNNSALKPSPYINQAPGCFNNTLCHGVAGHASDPAPWSAAANHGSNPGITGRPGAKFSIQACQSCHATMSTTANPYPLFTNPKTGMLGGCSSTGCHDQNVNLAHPYVWLPNRVPGITTSHASAGDLGNSCVLCHGAALTGGDAAPSCMSASVAGIRCHSSNPAVTPTGCTSCHGNPPSGLAAPNTNNKHSAHFTNIPGLTCAACHNGFSGPPQATHANGAVNRAFNSIFDDGVASYTAGVGCSGVSCHGGKSTPAWNTTANPNYVYDATGANCTSNCHTLVNNASNVPGSQYINVYNGDPNATLYYDITPSFNQHDWHVTVIGAACTDCHGLAPDKLPQFHFNGLSNGKRQFISSDPTAAGFAAGTIGGVGTEIIGAYTYDGVPPGPIPRGSCLANCHNTAPRFWFLK